MLKRFPRFLKVGSAALALTLPALAAAQTSPAPSLPPAPVGGFRFPPDYLSRFGGAEVVIDNTVGYGVRYLPLPFTRDVRFSLVKRPNYWEYALSTRVNETTIAAGVFDNGSAAPAGLPRLEVTHDPFKGVQYSGVIQGRGAFSRFAGGYAFTVAHDRVRVLNNVGVAYENNLAAPYTQTVVGGGYNQNFGRFRAGFDATGRVYTFPVQKQAQGSVDLVVRAGVTPVPGLSLDASHLERFAAGSVAIPAFNLGRYEESNAVVTYRLPVGSTPSDFGLGALRSRVTRDWTGDNTYLRNDVLFRVNAFPSLVGPTIGYQWMHNTKDSRWLFGVSFLPK